MLKGVNDVQALSVVLGQYVVKVKADVVVVYVPKGLGGWATLELYQSDLLVDKQGNVMGDRYYVFSLLPASTEHSSILGNLNVEESNLEVRKNLERRQSQLRL